MQRNDDRYEPLPGLLSLPGFLYRKLGRRGRLAAWVGAGVLLAAVVAAAVVVLPEISESNRERAADERRAAAAALAERRRRIIEEQRPRSAPAERGVPRAALVTRLEGRILADAQARVREGSLPGPPAKRVSCERSRAAGNSDPDRVAYDCIAVTSDLPAVGGAGGGVLGHPFRGVVDQRAGRLTWCKISGRPNEGDVSGRALVQIPPACSA